MAKFSHTKPILEAMKKGQYAAVYFLEGPETHAIDTLIQYIEKNALAPANKALNSRTYYGREEKLQDVLSRARCVPMLGSRQVVLVKEAQEMTDLQSSAGQEKLLQYLNQANPKTILAFAYKHKTLRKQTLLQAFAKNAQQVLLTTKKIYDSQVPQWVERYVAEKGYRIAPKAILMLQGLLGTDLVLIANSLQKIMLNIPKSTCIEEEHIAQHIGMQRILSPFELQHALGVKDKPKAFEILYYFRQNSKQYPIIPLIALLTNFFLKLLQLHTLPSMPAKQLAETLQVHPYFIKEYQKAALQHSPGAITHHLQALHQADLQLKGINAPAPQEQEIIKALVARLLLNAIPS